MNQTEGNEKANQEKLEGKWRVANSLVTLCSFDFIVSPAQISFLSTFRILKEPSLA